MDTNISGLIMIRSGKAGFTANGPPRHNALYLTGDFNNWDRFSHPLQKNEFGIWEIFLDKKQYQDSFTHGSKIKVLVDSNKGLRYRIPAYITRAVQDEDTKNFTGQVWFPGNFDWSADVFNAGDLGELFIYEGHVGMAQEKEGLGYLYGIY